MIQPTAAPTPEPTAQPTALHLAFLGGGNMARALILGLLKPGAGQLPLGRITVIDPAEPTRAQLLSLAQPPAQDAGVALIAIAPGQLPDAAPPPDWLVLAVKPQIAAEALAGLQRENTRWVSESPLLSVAAGLPVARLAAWLGHSQVVRCMPNTPALIGHGITGIFASPALPGQQRAEAEGLLRSVGEVLWLEQEELLDAVTAVSGSGPAYCFLLAEAMAQAGVSLGLSPEQSSLLARHTLAGAGLMLSQAEESAEVLRARVTSPGGTTAAALEVFEREGLRELVQQALTAARDRSQTLSRA